MPYACLVFDDDVEASMRSTAGRIAASSGFLPEVAPYHVPLLGGLHKYTEPEVRQALTASADGPLTGRFVKWEIVKSRLRAVVQLANDDHVQRLQRLLPSGTPWRSHYLVLGSLLCRHRAIRQV